MPRAISSVFDAASVRRAAAQSAMCNRYSPSSRRAPRLLFAGGAALRSSMRRPSTSRLWQRRAPAGISFAADGARAAAGAGRAAARMGRQRPLHLRFAYRQPLPRRGLRCVPPEFPRSRRNPSSQCGVVPFLSHRRGRRRDKAVADLFPQRPIVVGGYSLGGNFALRVGSARVGCGHSAGLGLRGLPAISPRGARRHRECAAVLRILFSAQMARIAASQAIPFSTSAICSHRTNCAAACAI